MMFFFNLPIFCLQQSLDNSMLKSSFLSCVLEKFYSPSNFLEVEGCWFLLAKCISKLVACYVSGWFGELDGVKEAPVELAIRMD